MDGHPGSTSPTRADSQLRRWRRRRGDGRTSREYIAYTAILHPSKADAQLASPCRGPSLRPTLPFSRSHRRGSVGGPLVTTLADGVTIGGEPLPRYRPDGLRIPRDLPPWPAWVCIATDSLAIVFFHSVRLCRLGSHLSVGCASVGWVRVCRFVPREPVSGGLCASGLSRAPLCPPAPPRVDVTCATPPAGQPELPFGI